jgi:NADH-ubiquinone oxidoreductase chain 2
LLIGTIAGLSQIKIKRLLAFSSISHVGFLLLALSIFSQKSIDSFIFYLIQYSITSLNIFLILLAFGYLNFVLKGPVTTSALFIKNQENAKLEPTLQEAQSITDINYLMELKGQLYVNPILSMSLAICLFSMAGIPPLIGFFSKQFVLFSSIENGNYFLSIVAILVSVISASYYLKLIKITFFNENLNTNSLTNFNGQTVNSFFSKSTIKIHLTNIHSYLISILTFFILFFFIDPTILLNGTQLISLTIFNI